jgi:zinc transporter, ZIP family
VCCWPSSASSCCRLRCSGHAGAIIAAFFTGGVAFLGLDAAAHVVQRRLGRKWNTSTAAVFGAVWIDLFTDGLMIGSSTTVATSLAFLVALGQTPADIPEGFASAASLASRGVPAGRRVLWSALFTVPIVVGTLAGYLAVRSAPDLVKLLLLAFSAGMLLTVVIEEIVPEAHDESESRWAVFALLGGFSVFALISAYLD